MISIYLRSFDINEKVELQCLRGAPESYLVLVGSLQLVHKFIQLCLKFVLLLLQPEDHTNKFFTELLLRSPTYNFESVLMEFNARFNPY